MAPINRRVVVQRAAVLAGALCWRPIAALAGTRQTRVSDGEPSASLDAGAVRTLASKLTGQLITPATPEYDSARLLFNRAFDRHPALIVRCAVASDIARTLDFAQRHDLRVALRGGGHNRAGFSSCDGGVVIDTKMMNRVTIDAAARVAHAQAGALTVHLDAMSQRDGLATTLAGCPTVGIAGLTLGGGEGLLMSKYGAACDNLISAQLVTADGRHLRASQNTNSDLFWAIRGGGGNFGVVTDLEFQLHAINEVLAGTLVSRLGGSRNSCNLLLDLLPQRRMK